MRRHKYLSIATAIALLNLSGSEGFIQKDGRKIDIFRLGEFKCSNLDKSEEIATEINRLKMSTDLYKRRSFIVAYIKIYRKSKFKSKVFYEKMIKYYTLISPCIGSEQYIIMFEKIYNYRNTNKVNLRF